MKRLYEIELQKKPDAKKLLESDPYAEVSFARNGYKLKDGASLGAGEASKSYLLLASEDEKFFSFAKEKLGDLAKEVEGGVKEKVIAKIEEEEAGAEAGVGAIFG